MKYLSTFILSCILLLSSALAMSAGPSKGKNMKLNKGQVNSTIKQATNPGNSSLLSDESGNSDKDKDKDSRLEKSLHQESKKAIRKAIK